MLRLPWELAPLFRQWLALHHPDQAERVMVRVQDKRGGKDCDADFATRMKGQGIWADLLRQRLAKTAIGWANSASGTRWSSRASSLRP